MEGISDGIRRKMLTANPCLLAYLGAPKTSSSSLGFLGCLVFGLLFWKEKQATAANAASLEDVQLCIKKAETTLSSQTRSSIGYKLEESQLGVRNESDMLQHDDLQHQIYNIKSSIAENELKLSADKHVSAILKQQVGSLTASVEKLKKDCGLLMANVVKQSSFTQGLEVDIHSVDVNLKGKGDEICTLTVAAAEQEKACNKLRQEILAVERSLDTSNNEVLNLQTQFENLKRMLHASNATAELLLKDLNTATTGNETLEAKFTALFRTLQFEKASSERLMAEQNELLAKKKKEVVMLFDELKCQQDDLDGEVKTVTELTSQRDELDKLSGEKKSTIGDLRQALTSELERLRIFKTEMSTLHQKLRHEQARNAALKLASEDSTVLVELMKVSSELEGQLKTEKKLTEQLENELHVGHEALHLLRVEGSALHDSIQFISSSQVHLQEDLARFTEVHKALSQALKREKRAAAYARKQLTLTTKAMMDENQIMEELHRELEVVRKVIKDVKLQTLSQASQLEQAMGTAEHLADDVLALRTALKEEQTQQRHFREKDMVSTTVARPPSRRGMSKPATVKSRRNSS